MCYFQEELKSSSMRKTLNLASFIVGLTVSIIESLTGVIYYTIITNRAYLARIDDPEFLMSAEDGASSLFYAQMFFEGLYQALLYGTH